MAHDFEFDLEELVNVEQTFYEHGYKDGFAHGRVHGLVEGRALGREKGFEMWEELGFYEGFARMWGALLRAQGGGANTNAGGTGADERAQNHIRHLLELVARFPRVNPSAGTGSDDPERDVDIPRLFRQIRSRYKLLCATLGVRPSLRAADDASPSPSRAEGEGEGEASPDRPPGQGHDDLGGGMDMDTDVGRTPSATGRVATRTERKKAAVWAVRDPRADRTPGGGGGAELSF